MYPVPVTVPVIVTLVEGRTFTRDGVEAVTFASARALPIDTEKLHTTSPASIHSFLNFSVDIESDLYYFLFKTSMIFFISAPVKLYLFILSPEIAA